MSNIADVIAWKFPGQPGMVCREVDGVLAIVEFPGGLPSADDQSAWTGEYLAWLAAQAAAKEAEAARVDAIRQDPICTDLLERLRSFTPAQIDSYVDSNITDLASARALFKRILMMLALLARSV